jgi:hypothetical protein
MRACAGQRAAAGGNRGGPYLELVAELGKSLSVGLVQVEVHKSVEEGTTHKELKGKVVDTLGILLDCENPCSSVRIQSCTAVKHTMPQKTLGQ